MFKSRAQDIDLQLGGDQKSMDRLSLYSTTVEAGPFLPPAGAKMEAVLISLRVGSRHLSSLYFAKQKWEVGCPQLGDVDSSLLDDNSSLGPLASIVDHQMLDAAHKYFYQDAIAQSIPMNSMRGAKDSPQKQIESQRAIPRGDPLEYW